MCFYIFIRNLKKPGWLYSFIIFSIILPILNSFTIISYPKIRNVIIKSRSESGITNYDQKIIVKQSILIIECANNLSWLPILFLG